jgi:murein DD-endopeptidase MepM/ murein hydrolase activator NlpD
MKKLLIILFLSFGLTSFVSKSTDNSAFESERKEMVIKLEYINFRNQLMQSVLEKGIKVSSFESLPMTSPVKIEEIERIGDLFGWRTKHPILKIGRHHRGIDIVADFNSNVYATAPGVVICTNRSRWGYGNEVVIQHDNNLKTRFAHLNEINVQIGDTIIRNTKIGTIGSTGLSTGSHLHYEILLNNVQIDPLSIYPNIFSLDKRENYVNILIKLENYIIKQLLK